MSPCAPSRGRVRSAEELNAAIRALWPCPAVRLRPEQRVLYQRLVVEWAAAVRAERVRVAQAA